MGIPTVKLTHGIIALGFALSHAYAADLPGWKLVWSDEFDKPGAPNAAKWSYEKGFVRNKEKQYYTENRRENARVENGKLIIEARKEKFQNADYTAASLTTRNHASWKHGRIEVSAELPAARGSWPAIWMLPTDIGKIPWPRCGEIDIMEHVGFDPGVIHGTLHSESYNHIKNTQRGTQIELPAFSKKFHTYALEWSADKIVMQIDGKTFATYSKKPGDKEAEWPFDKPYYLILNLAVGGSWGGAKGIDETAFPQRMEVDYVRVYESNAANCGRQMQILRHHDIPRSAVSSRHPCDESKESLASLIASTPTDQAERLSDK